MIQNSWADSRDKKWEKKGKQKNTKNKKPQPSKRVASQPRTSTRQKQPKKAESHSSKNSNVSDYCFLFFLPDNFFEYWQVRKTRGLMSAYQPYYLFGKSKLYLFCKFIAKDLLLFLKLIFIIPWIHTTFCVYKYSSNPRLDFLKFLYTGFLQEIGMIWGEWEGFWKIYSYKYNNYDKPIEISDVS